MIKGKLWIKGEWSEPLDIISITPIVMTTPIFHVIYIDEYGDLETFICDSLTSIKIIK